MKHALLIAAVILVAAPGLAGGRQCWRGDCVRGYCGGGCWRNSQVSSNGSGNGYGRAGRYRTQSNTAALHELEGRIAGVEYLPGSHPRVSAPRGTCS